MVFSHKKKFTLNKLAENPFKKYKSKNSRVLKYGLMTIGGVGFILLLILPNVDFTGTCYSHMKLDADNTSSTSTTTNQALYETAILVFSENTSCHLNANVSRCTFDMQNCTVHCIGHNVSTLYILDECTDGIKLTLESANFANSQWNSTVFSQQHTLRELSIQNSNLSHNFDNFFQKEHFAQLENLTLSNNYMQQLDANTFTGLPQLKQLNLQATHTVSNCSFLKPLNATLHSLQLRLSTSQKKQCGPETWFSYNTLYPELEYVNLSGNNFQESISNESFSMLIAVKQLILSDCNISYLPSDTFQSIDQHLESLDLSGNLLTKSTGLENSYFSQGMTANLQQNLWDCNCSNLALLHTFNRKDIKLEKAVFCATPADYAHLLVTEVVNGCQIYEQAAIAERSLALTGRPIALQLYCSLPWSINNIKGPVILQEISRFLLEQTKPGSVNITIYFNTMDSTLYYYGRPSNDADYKFIKNQPSFETAPLAFISTMNKSSGGIAPVLHSVEKVQVDRIHVEVSGLVSNMNYLFCLVPSDSEYSSPFDCQSWTEHGAKEFTNTVWINNENKPWIVLTIVIILTVCFSFSFGFVIIRHVRNNAKQKQHIDRLSVKRSISLSSSADLQLDLSSKSENCVEQCCVGKVEDDSMKSVKNATDGCISFVYESISSSDASNMKILHNNSLYEEYYEELF